MIANLDPADDEQSVLLELTRRDRAGRKHFDAAKENIARAHELDADNRTVAELGAMAVLSEAQFGSDEDEVVTVSELKEAGNTLARLGREMQSDGHIGAAANLFARGAFTLGLAGEELAAGHLLDQATELGDGEEQASSVAQAAILLGRYELVSELALGHSEPARLMRASAATLSEDHLAARTG